MQIARVLGLVVGLTAAPAMAQQDQTLADIRQELSVLFVEVQRLKQELNTSGAPSGTGGGSVLDRVNAIEMELQQLTSKSEELEFRIDRIVRDGTNRIGDLEFRI
ncbi:MAG: tol-pal system protein, partial [Pseudomonadota bacterium]